MTNLEKKRKAAGLTQVELAKKAGINQAQVSCYENGLRIPAATLEMLSSVLDCDADELVGEVVEAEQWVR